MSFTGCARHATPEFYYGNYYMTGDDNCRRRSLISDTRIMCYDADSNEMGYRDAMTNQQLSMYQHNQQVKQQQSQAFNQSLQNMSNQLNYNTQQQINRNNYNTQQWQNRNNTYKFQEVGPYGY